MARVPKLVLGLKFKTRKNIELDCEEFIFDKNIIPLLVERKLRDNLLDIVGLALISENLSISYDSGSLNEVGMDYCECFIE